MDQVSTNTVFEALKERITDEVHVDDVLIFDGTLQAAIDEHFSQTTRSGGRVVYLTLTDSGEIARSGHGTPVRENLLVDIYVVFRVQGRGRYEETRAEFWDVCDAIVHDAFHLSNLSQAMKENIMGTNFISRSRLAHSGDILAHSIRYEVVPARTS